MKRKYKNIVWALVGIMVVVLFWVGALINDSANYRTRLDTLEEPVTHTHDMKNYRTHQGFQLVDYVECEICGCLVRKDKAVVSKEIRVKGDWLYKVYDEKGGIDSALWGGHDYIHYSYTCKHCVEIVDPVMMERGFQFLFDVDTVKYMKTDSVGVREIE